jgi:hypothetical protein
MPKLPRKYRTCPTKHSARAQEKHELLLFVFVHDSSPSLPILFLCRGARMCHRSPTNGLVVEASCGLALISEIGGQHRKRAVLWVRE